MRPTHQHPIADGPSASRLPPPALRRGFTLVELLVVITIIGILAALLLNAVTGALAAANETAIAAEISTIDGTMEQYKNDLAGGSYPPDIGVGVGAPAAVRRSIESDFVRHFNKVFNRHREPEVLLRALAGVNTAGSPTPGPAVAENPNVPGGLNPAEALVFYLQKFSSDPQYPITGSGGPSFEVATSALPEDLASRNWIRQFEPTRYGMLVGGNRRSVQDIYQSIDDDNSRDYDASELAMIPRFVRYQDPRDPSGATVRQINFWQYFPPKSPQPLVYFDASRGIHDVSHPSLFAGVHALKTLKPGATNPIVGNVTLANAGKFQVLHCGLDEAWGDFDDAHFDLALLSDATQAALNSAGQPLLLYPDGPFTLELADTIINFSDRRTLEDSQP